MLSESPFSTPVSSTATKSFFVEDLAVSKVSDIVHQQMDQDRQQVEEGITDTPPPPPPMMREAPVSQRIRNNLIRHRYARSSDMTTLKLFKSFASALRASDKELTILPFDSNKQQYTSIASSAGPPK
jgi:hypothetical protein